MVDISHILPLVRENMMIKLYDLLIEPLNKLADIQPLNPVLVDPRSLDESTILDILYVSTVFTAGVLIDLRTSLYFSDADYGNTGVLVIRHLSKLDIQNKKNQNTNRYINILGDIEYQRQNNKIIVSLNPFGLRPITFEGEICEFYTGTVNDIDTIASSLDDGYAGFRDTTPNWEMQVELITKHIF
jgi:hypothetical protein